MAVDKGWFSTSNRIGDRTLDQQMLGLTPLLKEVNNKTVLDLGCAEGLISLEMIDHGAISVHGVEIVPGHVELAKSISKPFADQCTFEVGDCNTYIPDKDYDVVLALALLHKLRDPTAACMRFANRCRQLMVIRMPPAAAPFISDSRSGNVPHDISGTMKKMSFRLDTVTRSYLNEWCGYYRRTNG